MTVTGGYASKAGYFLPRAYAAAQVQHWPARVHLGNAGMISAVRQQEFGGGNGGR
ncbi:MAG: hypothetical protein ACREDJ_07995 [Methylocella sp.]